MIRQLAFYEVTQVFFGTIAALGAFVMVLLGRRLDDVAVELVALTAWLERRARAARDGRRENASPQPLDSPLPSV
jgi:hypothetical protein